MHPEHHFVVAITVEARHEKACENVIDWIISDINARDFGDNVKVDAHLLFSED